MCDDILFAFVSSTFFKQVIDQGAVILVNDMDLRNADRQRQTRYSGRYSALHASVKSEGCLWNKLFLDLFPPRLKIVADKKKQQTNKKTVF